MRIMIVDDSKAMRMIITRALRQAGYGHHTLEQASNGAEALQAIRTAAPDIVLSDWNMPDMSGIQLLEALRADGVQLTFGFVTAEGSPEIRKAAMAAGALFLITKPFTVESFQEALAPVMP